MQANEAFSTNDPEVLLEQSKNITSHLAEATSSFNRSLFPADIQITNAIVDDIVGILEDTATINPEPDEVCI